MSEPLYRIDYANAEAGHWNIDYLLKQGVLVKVDPDEYVRRRDVCICALGEGFDPQPSDLHNSWCSYEPEAGQ